MTKLRIMTRGHIKTFAQNLQNISILFIPEWVKYVFKNIYFLARPLEHELTFFEAF